MPTIGRVARARARAQPVLQLTLTLHPQGGRRRGRGTPHPDSPHGTQERISPAAAVPRFSPPNGLEANGTDGYDRWVRTPHSRPGTDLRSILKGRVHDRCRVRVMVQLESQLSWTKKSGAGCASEGPSSSISSPIDSWRFIATPGLRTIDSHHL